MSFKANSAEKEQYKKCLIIVLVNLRLAISMQKDALISTISYYYTSQIFRYYYILIIQILSYDSSLLCSMIMSFSVLRETRTPRNRVYGCAEQYFDINAPGARTYDSTYIPSSPLIEDTATPSPRVGNWSVGNWSAEIGAAFDKRLEEGKSKKILTAKKRLWIKWWLRNPGLQPHEQSSCTFHGGSSRGSVEVGRCHDDGIWLGGEPDPPRLEVIIE